MTSYARPELLASTEWLARHISDADVRVVDCDEYVAYFRLHIAGAVGIPFHHYLKDAGGVHLMPAADFEQAMGSLGISNDTTVVGYDSYGGLYAARLWWALDHFGHTKYRLLDGGFRSWYLEGRAVTVDLSTPEPASFRARVGRDNMCGIDDVRGAIDRDDTVIWDARSRAEHTGDDPRANRHGGHIPGAVNMEWVEMTEKPIRSGKLLPADEIQTRLDRLGITPGKAVITHCQAGIRAAHAMFVLELMGHENAKVYDASWEEWGNRDDTPIVKGAG